MLLEYYAYKQYLRFKTNKFITDHRKEIKDYKAQLEYDRAHPDNENTWYYKAIEYIVEKFIKLPISSGISYITPYSKFQMYRNKKVRDLEFYEKNFELEISNKRLKYSNIFLSYKFNIAIMISFRVIKYLFGHNERFHNTVIHYQDNLKDSYKSMKGRLM